MAIAILIVIGVAVCLAVQLLVRRYWLGFFLSVLAIMVAWIVTPLVFAWAATDPLVAPVQWSTLEALLGALFIAQCIARTLIIVRRMLRDD